jgi:hypothetical protein
LSSATVPASFANDSQISPIGPVKVEGTYVDELVSSDEPADIVADTRNPAYSILSSSTTIFSEDFEGAFPSTNWWVGDDDANNGYDYWDDVANRAYGGTWSGWCAAVGTKPDGTPNTNTWTYDNYMKAYLSRRAGAPFDARSWDIAFLTYRVWYYTESNFDHLDLSVTGDGSNWGGIFQYKDNSLSTGDWVLTGNSGGWQYRIGRVPESTSAGKVYTSSFNIGYYFQSNSSITREGAYLDDIALKVYDITTDEVSISTTSAYPGDTIKLGYKINNVSPYTLKIWLGATIIDQYGNNIHDPANDALVSVPSGFTYYYRDFKVPTTASPGKYDIVYALWSGWTSPIDQSRQWWTWTWNDILNVQSANHAPDLTDGYVDPDPGYTDTNFKFLVKYKDQDGDAAVLKKIYVYDGGWWNFDMDHLVGNPTDGEWFIVWLTGFSLGSHDFYFYFTDGELSDREPTSGYYSFDVVERPKPDLVISDITWSPSSPKAGDTMTFTVYIKNQGSADTSLWGSFDVEYYIDSSKLGSWTIANILAGSTVSKQFTWTATRDNHKVSAYADKSGYIPESDESNNYKEKSFSVVAGTVTITGYLYFWDDEGNQEFLDGACVELFDDDLVFDNWIDTTYTTSDGYFVLGPVENVDNEIGESGTRDLYIEVWASNWAASVIDSVSTTWHFRTDTLWDVSDGEHNWGNMPVPDDRAPAFNILNAATLGARYIDIFDETPAEVTIVWYPGYSPLKGTAYDPITDTIKLQGKADDPDQWDECVIIHEYGHFIMDTFGDWTLMQKISKSEDEMRWIEGWAQFFQSPVRDYYEFSNPWIYWDKPFTTDETGTNLETWTTTKDTYNWVASILWDIYDGDVTYPSADDDDELYLEFNEIWDVFRNYDPDPSDISHNHPWTVDEFWNGWFARGHGFQSEMWSIFNAHGENKDNGPPNNPSSFTSSHQVMIWSNDNTIQVIWSGATDDLSGVQGYSFVWDNSPTTLPPSSDPMYWTTGTLSISQPLSDGTSWYLHIRTRDRAGNWADTAYHIGPFYIDRTPPSTPSPDADPSGWSTDNTPTIYSYFVSDAGTAQSGINRYEYQIDSTMGIWTSVGLASSFDVPAQVDGIHTVYVRAVDNAGNPSTAGSVYIYIDTTTPQVDILSPSDGVTITSSTVDITWTGSDSASGINHYEIRLDSGSWINKGLSTSHTFSDVAEGPHTVEVKAVDNTYLERIHSHAFDVVLAYPTETEIVGGVNAVIDRSSGPTTTHPTTAKLEAKVKNLDTGSYLSGVGIVEFWVNGILVGSDSDADANQIYEYVWNPSTAWLNLGSQPWEARFMGTTTYDPSAASSTLTVHGQLYNTLLSPNGETIKPSDTIQIAVQVTSDSPFKDNIKDCQVTATLHDPEGFVHNIQLLDPDNDGIYTATFSPMPWPELPNGAWTIEVVSSKTNYHNGVLPPPFTPLPVAFYLIAHDVNIAINPPIASVFPGSTTSFTIYIENTGSVRDTYELTLQGLPSAWYLFSQESIVVDPGQTQTSTLTTSPPLDALLTDYSFTVTVTCQKDPTVSESVNAVLEVTYNLIQNPGFEAELGWWSISGGTATYTVSSVNPKYGTYSAFGQEVNEGSLGRLYQDVTGIVSSGRKYKISGWLKTEGVAGYVVIALDYVTSGGWSPADGYVKEIGYVTGTSDWTYFESAIFTLPPMPADCVACWFLFDFNAGKGLAWWDDVQLVEVTARILHITAQSPINILVTDPIGRRVGYSPDLGLLNEIPGATYTGPGTEPQVVQIYCPLQGEYTIDIFGTGTGAYTISMESLAHDGSTIDTATWTGTTELGQQETRTAEIEPDGTITDITPPTTLHDYDDLWHKSDFTITLTATDDMSGVAETYYKINDGPTKTVSADGQPIISTESTDNKFEYWSLDNAGNEESHHILTGIKLDKTPPIISGAPTTSPNAYGWYNTDVTVHFVASDTVSGVDFVTPDQTFTAEGADQSMTGMARDIAGNVAYFTVTGIYIDKTPPTITGAPTTLPNVYGWYKTDVTVHFEASDVLSGIDFLTPDQTLTTEGMGQYVVGTARDRAGNEMSYTVSGINIDKTSPVITGAATTSPNAYGWYNTDVVVYFDASDTLSGIDTLTPEQTLTSEGADQSVQGTAVDKASNIASYTVSGINIDKTPPTISGAATTSPNAYGWYNADVIIHFEASDALSSLDSVTPNQTLTAEAYDQSVSGTAIDKAGNTASYTVSGINIDKTPPAITGAPTTSPNSYGWYKTDVIVHFTASDLLSGIDTFTPDQTLSTEASEQSVTGTATDKAGNIASFTVLGINIDKTPPSISGAPTTPPNLHGWYNTNVVVQFTATDVLSGIAELTPEQTLTTEGVGQFVFGFATDKAGNAAFYTVNDINIDKTPPTITGAPTEPANAYGWYQTDVTIHFTASDTLSGIDTITPDQILSAEAADQSVTGYVTDLAGNAASFAVTGISIDKTLPSITGVPTTPANTYGWYKTDVVVHFDASDLLSGLDTVTLDQTLSSEGAGQSVTGIAIDRAGNSASFTVTDINIDKTPPSINGAPTTPSNVHGWYNTDVTVHFIASDSLSGIDTVTSDQTLSSEGAGQSVTGTAVDKAGNIAVYEVTGIDIDKTNPTSTLTIGEPKSCTDPTYVSTTTEFSIEATDGLSGLHQIEYKIDLGSWTLYSAPFTVLDFGSHTVYYRSIDMADNIEDAQSVWIIVNSTSLTYSGDTSGQYSDSVTVQAVLIDLATQLRICGKTMVFAIGSQSIVSVTDNSGVATASIVLNQPSGTYTVDSAFTGDLDFLGSFDSEQFVIRKENATLEYTGETVVPTTAKTINLRATIFESQDGLLGDLTKMKVTFSIYAGQLGSVYKTISGIPVSKTDAPGIGVAVTTIDNLPENGYLIIVSIDANDYYRGPTSDPTVLTVYEPTGSFVTGGGWIWDPTGSKGNFGFNVKYTKSGKPQGHSIYVYREGGWDYIIKSNAWIGFAIDGNHAYFEAKCVVQKYNPETGELLWAEGNYQFRVDVWDNDSNGAIDVYQIRVRDKNGVVYHEAGFDPYGELQGGNIVIHDEKKKP